jgi:hypothetical protein
MLRHSGSHSRPSSLVRISHSCSPDFSLSPSPSTMTLGKSFSLGNKYRNACITFFLLFFSYETGIFGVPFMGERPRLLAEFCIHHRIGIPWQSPPLSDDSKSNFNRQFFFFFLEIVCLPRVFISTLFAVFQPL